MPDPPATVLEQPRATTTMKASPKRPTLLFAVSGGLCWAFAIVMILSGHLETEDVFAPVRIIFYIAILLAGVSTFVPIQRQLNIPGLAFEGIAGSSLLLYTLAFVPPPTGWLLALPDTPVYIIFAAALFWTTSAIMMPLMYVLGQRIFRQRVRKYDLHRARRQAHEVGFLLALCAILAGLRVLTPIVVVLLVLILVVSEILFLSFIETSN